MLSTNFLLALLASSVLALPLNINLGAYSPALVVGDGEISFGNAERAGEVMETLASGAAVAGNAGQQQQQGTPAPAPAVEGAPAPAAPAPEGGAPPEGETPAPPEPRIRYHVTPPAAKRALSGAAAPPPEKRDLETSPAASVPRLLARDINGFREALNYAREAMKNTPKLEIGSEEAGVGIVQNAGINVAANSAANGQLPAGQPAPAGAKRRREIQGQEETGKTGITLLAIAEV